MTRDDLIKKHIGNPTNLLRKDINALLDEYASQFSQPASSKGIEWVKWSDKIPDDWEGKINRIISSKIVIDNSNYIHEHNCLIGLDDHIKNHQYEELEWLDEHGEKQEESK